METNWKREQQLGTHQNMVFLGQNYVNIYDSSFILMQTLEGNDWIGVQKLLSALNTKICVKSLYFMLT